MLFIYTLPVLLKSTVRETSFFEGLLNVLIINQISGLFTVGTLPIFEATQTKAGIWRSSECTGLK
jgi:hypothetical protein